MRRSKKAEITIMLVFSLWLLLVIVAPLSLPRGSVQDLSGKVGGLENSDQLDTMNPLARIIYSIGDMYCHQIADRSLFLNENQMPFCSRDLGIFIGLVSGMLFAIFLSRRTPLLLIILLLAPMVIDGSVQLLTGYESSNLVRLITGLMAGVGVALLMSRLVRQVLDVYDESPRSVQS